jgi:hypothetical protein
VIEHALRLDPKIPLKRQKLRVISPQKRIGSAKQSGEAVRCGGHQRNIVHNLALQHNNGTEEEWGAENVH